MAASTSQCQSVTTSARVFQQHVQELQQQQPAVPMAMDWQLPAAVAAQGQHSQQVARHSSLPEGSQRQELQWRPTV